MLGKSKEEYLELINENFPEVKHSSAKLVTKGWDNDVVILDNKYVFRFPKRDEYVSKLESEIKLLKYLAPLMPIAVPEYTYVSNDLSFGGYKLIQGTEMSFGVFKTLKDSSKKKIAEQLGTFFMIMHSTPVKIAEEFGIEGKNGYWWDIDHTKTTLEKLKEKIFYKLSEKEVEWIEHQFNMYLSLSFDFEVALLHSDLDDDHIFIDQDAGELIGIIDFADAELSDPALDFSGMWRYGESFILEVLNHYEGKVDDDFIHRSKFPYLVSMINNMLELEEGKIQPQTFDDCHRKLDYVMKSGLTL